MYLAPGHPPLAYHPFANLLPMMSADEAARHRAHLKDHGQLETIKLHKGMILDGRNRYEALIALGHGVRAEAFEGTDRQALDFVIGKNIERRHLSESQRAMVAAKLTTLRLGSNQHVAPAPIGAGSLFDEASRTSLVDASSALPPEAAISQTEAGERMNVSRRSVQRAAVVEATAAPAIKQRVEQGTLAVSTAAAIAEALPLAEQAQLASLSEKEILAQAKRIRKDKATARRAERVERIAKISAGNAPLSTVQRYPVGYVDPPTKFAAGDSEKSTENHYPTMTEEELAALPIADLMTPDAVLFIWSTVPWLAKTLRLIEGFGFAYVSELVWDKERIGPGFWNRNQHECLLIATRGNFPAPPPEDLMPSLYREPRGEHSAKPAYFRDLITRYYPSLPKVELFARDVAAPPPGWTFWGNEARIVKQQALALEPAP